MRKPLRIAAFLVFALLPLFTLLRGAVSDGDRPIVLVDINGPINPATDDYLKSAMSRAVGVNSRLMVIRLNTPGGLVPSMQSMVQILLQSEVPVAVYVTPAGGSATSAGVFITLAGNVAAMAPGTTIGAAHPVMGDGQSMEGDMRAKVENFAVSLIRAIAEQRQRNVQWAEQAVRESVSITDREALSLKVIDLVAPDLTALLGALENRTVQVKGNPVTLTGLADAPREEFSMSFKQRVINVIADPNVTVLLGLGAMLGIGIELYHPGAVLPGIVGVVCLLLSLGSAQVLPINHTGLGLLLLGGAFFVVELFMPSFGIWGGAGLICLVLGSIYLIDEGGVYGGIAVDSLLLGGVAAVVGAILMTVSFLAVGARRKKVTTGSEGMVGAEVFVKTPLVALPGSEDFHGKVTFRGELWNATASEEFSVGERVQILSSESLRLRVGRIKESEGL